MSKEFSAPSIKISYTSILFLFIDEQIPKITDKHFDFLIVFHLISKSRKQGPLKEHRLDA